MIHSICCSGPPSLFSPHDKEMEIQVADMLGHKTECRLELSSHSGLRQPGVMYQKVNSRALPDTKSPPLAGLHFAGTGSPPHRCWPLYLKPTSLSDHSVFPLPCCFLFHKTFYYLKLYYSCNGLNIFCLSFPLNVSSMRAGTLSP